MNNVLIAAAAVLALAAPVAFADSTVATNPSILPTEHCNALAAQFAKEEGSYTSSPNYAAAEKMKTQGLALCRQDKHKEGVARLEKGLRLLNIVPVKS